MPHKTIVITRPPSDAEVLMQALQESGHHAICEPLTEIFLNHTVRPELARALLGDPHAVIATSRNGVRALAALSELRDMMLLCVGESTEAVAQSAGFTRTSACGGDVQAMVDTIINAYDSGSHFVYVAATHTSEDLPGLLSAFGMQLTPIIAYNAVASEALSDTLIEQMRRNQIDGITFMSPRTAEIFMQLADKAGINDALPVLEAFCLSENVSKPLRAQVWKNIHIAKQPTLASLIACVDNA